MRTSIGVNSSLARTHTFNNDVVFIGRRVHGHESYELELGQKLLF